MMQKDFARIWIFCGAMIVGVLFCTTVTADIKTPAQEPLECPPISEIQKAQFIKAEENSLQGGVWKLSSDKMKINEKIWNVWFELYIAKPSNAKEALTRGQALFSDSTNYPLNPPIAFLQDHLKEKVTVCNYTLTKSRYVVVAYSPAQDELLPGTALPWIRIDFKLT